MVGINQPYPTLSVDSVLALDADYARQEGH
jgi:hypothetical protein